jgi:DNA polymerase I-like protein with 3'-5' exonuclease and polymerase domains
MEELEAQFPQLPQIYAFERALQGPYLEIMLRGFLVDELARRHAAQELRDRIGHLQELLDEFATAVWDRGLNPRSPKQLKEFFYDTMRLPEVWLSQKGERKLSTNREALEKLEAYLYARPFISLILSIRELSKQLEVFETDIDGDGRYRTSYNIAGTETGRPSSSQNAFGTGGNAQNIAPSLRYVFVADTGWKICVIDLEQVEARDVGFFCGTLFGDWTYLNACESGDLHTNNAKLVWPEQPWTGDRQADRKLANRIFYRDFSYRDMAKRGGHLSNYMGSAWMMSRALKIPMGLAEEFQDRYILGRAERVDKKTGQVLPEISPAFPCIPRWWQWTAQELQTVEHLTTPFGRKRHFFGRPGDDATVREAVAFLPQSTTADRMNLGLWRVWKYMPEVQLLAQTYDSITFQYRETENEDNIISRALELIRVELYAPGRKYVVPGEAKIGWNWGAQVTESDVAKAKAEGKKVPKINLGGLVKWNPRNRDQRQRERGLMRIML